MLVGEPGDEHVAPVVLARETQVVGLLTVFHAEGPLRIQQHGDRNLPHQRTPCLAVAAETEQPGLVGAGRAQGAVDQQLVTARRIEEQLGGADVHVGSRVVARTQRQRQGAVTHALALHPYADLRHAGIDQVAGDAQLGAKDVLAHRLPRQRQLPLQFAQVESLAGDGKLQAIVESEGGACRIHRIVAGIDPGRERGAAVLAVGAVTGQYRPGNDSATRTALQGGSATGRQQATLAAEGRWRQRQQQRRTSANKPFHVPMSTERRCTGT